MVCLTPYGTDLPLYADGSLVCGQASVELTVLPTLNYRISGEYVYTYNCDERILFEFFSACHAAQHAHLAKEAVYAFMPNGRACLKNRVDRKRPHAGCKPLSQLALLIYPVAGTEVEITLTVRNLFNTRYYNHLSFYRKVEIPEPGRNFQLLIKSTI